MPAAAAAAAAAAGASASTAGAAAAGASAARGLGALFSSIGRGLAGLGKNLVGLQVKLAYGHDQLLRKWGAAVIKHAEKFGVPKRFAREYVRRYMYPNLIGGPHGHRPHVRGGATSQPTQQVRPPGVAAQAAPTQSIRKPQTIQVAGPGAQHPPQQVAAEGAPPANVQFAAPAPIGTSYSSYVAGGDVSARTPTVSAPPQQQPSNVEFASGDDVVGLSLDFSNLAGVDDIDLAEGIGIMEHVQAQIAAAESSSQTTADFMEKTLSGEPGEAAEAGLEAGEAEAAKSMQLAATGFEKPDVASAAEAAIARAEATRKPVTLGLDVQPINVHYASASTTSKAPDIDVAPLSSSAPGMPLSPIHVAASEIPNVSESKVHATPPTAANTYTVAASGANTPQHIMFGPGRFEVT